MDSLTIQNEMAKVAETWKEAGPKVASDDGF
jgi:hypothetical protein